jgi:hypothetical protein
MQTIIILKARPFTRSDWDDFAGYERFSDGSEPLIRDLSDTVQAVADAHGIKIMFYKADCNYEENGSMGAARINLEFPNQEFSPAFSVEVGQRVAVVQYSSHRTNGHFATVVKINGHGHIHVRRESTDPNTLVMDQIFNKHGEDLLAKQRRSSYGDCLMDAAGFQAELDRQQTQSDLNKRMSAAANLAKSLTDSHKNGYGDYCSPLTAEEKQSLIDAINAI